MKKCSNGCIPCCDFCIHAEHEELFLEDGTYAGRGVPTHCKLHPDEKHDAFCETCSYCDDFYCFRAKNDKVDKKGSTRKYSLNATRQE